MCVENVCMTFVYVSQFNCDIYFQAEIVLSLKLLNAFVWPIWKLTNNVILMNDASQKLTGFEFLKIELVMAKGMNITSVTCLLYNVGTRSKVNLPT